MFGTFVMSVESAMSGVSDFTLEPANLQPGFCGRWSGRQKSIKPSFASKGRFRLHQLAEHQSGPSQLTFGGL